MSFIGGYQDRNDLRQQNLTDPDDLLGLVPEMTWAPRVTIPLRAGDCTFHHGRTPHMAGPNLTDEPRVAHVVIYIDADTIYDPSLKADHVATHNQNLKSGEIIEGDAFPRIEDILNGSVIVRFSPFTD